MQSTNIMKTLKAFAHKAQNKQIYKQQQEARSSTYNKIKHKYALVISFKV
jgi:hypothetical protein